MFKKNLFMILPLTFLFLFTTLAATATAQDHNYVGVKKCGMCHKKDKIGNQLKIWKESKHSKAYETLKSEEADKIAMEKYGKKAVEADECLKCHTTGHGLDAARFEKSFKITDGVQCENCHGAGKDYKKKKIMKDHAKSVENGLTEYADEAAIEKQCKTCHNEESPTYKEFDFHEMWGKIKHPVPADK